MSRRHPPSVLLHQLRLHRALPRPGVHAFPLWFGCHILDSVDVATRTPGSCGRTKYLEAVPMTMRHPLHAPAAPGTP